MLPFGSEVALSSLRDQLLKKGLVDKKRKRRIERELREERKQTQGARLSKRELETEAEQAEQAHRESVAAERAERRQVQREKAEAMQRRLRARNLVLGNRVASGRGQRFFYPKTDGRIGEIEVSSGIAFQLRCGEAALAELEDGPIEQVFVVRRRAALALREIAPHCVRFFVTEPEGLDAPDLAFHRRDWPVELGPHKATAADLQRFKG